MSIAKCDRFLIDGYELSNRFKSFAPSTTVDELDATVLASTYRQYETGFKNGTLSANGVFASDGTDLDDIHDVLAAAYGDGTAKVISCGVGFFAVGGDVVMLDGCEVKYTVPIDAGQLIFANPEFRSTNGVNFGKWLLSEQIDAGTVTGSAVDNGTATTNGGLFHVHLENTDASDVDTKVQHSTDNSTWVDLISVNNLSATHDTGTATVASGTTVNRYLRAVCVVTGGNTVLVSVAFARRY